MLEEDTVERNLQNRVDGKRLMENTAAVAEGVRLSGSEDEARAVEHIRKKLEAYGLETNLMHHDSYVSWPGPASLNVLAPTELEIEVITHSFGGSTGGLEGELVYVGQGRPADYAEVEAEGMIALCEGLVNPAKARAAEEAGVKAHIHIHDENFHEMIVSWVWGHPTPETADELPTKPVLGVREPDGTRLKELLEQEPVRVHLTAEVDTRWRTLPLLVADLPAPDSPEFVLLSGHVDSWHHGAMDNASANATMLEVARVLADRQGSLRRGLRLAFWSGHSHGRYSGSTWYADHAWRELEDHCACHVNVDSTGAVNADVLTEANVMAETTDLAAHAVEPLVDEGFVGTRQSRAGDQSFWGIGVPSLFMSLSQQEAEEGKAEQTFKDLIGEGKRGGGLGWWWHTVHDTLDKIDEQNLVRDTKIYVAVVWQLCTSPVLPLNYRRTAAELRQFLAHYQAESGDHFDLEEPLALVEELEEKLEDFYAAAQGLEENDPISPVVNWAIMQLGRTLVPIGYTRSGRFDQDYALPVEPLPGLAPAQELPNMEPTSNEYRFALTALIRQRNRAVYWLREADAVVEQALALLQH